MKEFNPEKILENIRAQKQFKRRTKYYHASKLDPVGHELLKLYEYGASITELKAWLDQSTKIKADRTTIYRWIQNNAKE